MLVGELVAGRPDARSWLFVCGLETDLPTLAGAHGFPSTAESLTDRDTFGAFILQGLEAVGATEKILADPAMELLLRASRGLPRVASKLLRAAPQLAHERDQGFLDENVLEDAIDDVLVHLPS